MNEQWYFQTSSKYIAIFLLKITEIHTVKTPRELCIWTTTQTNNNITRLNIFKEQYVEITKVFETLFKHT